MNKNLTGLVLASGGSSRMGSDKAALKFKGVSFLNVGIGHLKAAGCQDIYINNADNLADLIPNLGPLGGIYTALTSYQDVQYWLIIPIDMPLLTPEIITGLVNNFDNVDIAHYEDEVFPLLLKNSAKMQSKLAELAEDKTRTYSMRQFMKTFKVQLLPKPKGSEAAFTNINSPQDYKKLCI